MSKKSKIIIFKTEEEYRAYYALKNPKRKGSKYYQIGQDIAKEVCERVLERRK